MAGPISAVALGLSFPVFHHFQLWGLAWIALTPILWLLGRCTWKHGLLQALLFGYPFMVMTLAWVEWMGTLPWLLLALTQAAYIALFTVSIPILAPLWTRSDGDLRPLSWLQHVLAIVVPAGGWIVVEWLRSLGILSIPWGFVSTTQVQLWPLVSTARWWGAYGVSFGVVSISAALAHLAGCRQQDRTRAGMLIWMLITAIAGSAVVAVKTVPSNSGPPLRVALIQGYIGKESANSANYMEYRRRVLDVYSRMSLESAAHQPQVIVWPETVVPGSIIYDLFLHILVGAVAQQTQAYMIVGVPEIAPGAKRYNTALVLTPTGRILGRYDKEHIVPFGEFVPGRSWLPFLDAYGVPKTDLSRGIGHHPINTPLGDWGVMICYESMYPQIARQTVQGGADVLFVITNDEWFGTSSAPYDHAADGSFRAAETGRWLVQAGTTGVSFLADPAGRVYKATHMFTRTIVTGTVYRESGRTIYTWLGDWPPIAALVLLIGAFVGRLAQSRRRRALRPGEEKGIQSDGPAALASDEAPPAAGNNGKSECCGGAASAASGGNGEDGHDGQRDVSGRGEPAQQSRSNEKPPAAERPAFDLEDLPAWLRAYWPAIRRWARLFAVAIQVARIVLRFGRPLARLGRHAGRKEKKPPVKRGGADAPES
jgi:apolipoprotein N-acyltransferase